VEISYYAFRKVVKINHSESIVRPSEVRSTFISRKRKVHITLEVKNYATLIVYKSSLTNSNNVSNPTLIVSKCSDVISSKFKVIKFIL